MARNNAHRINCQQYPVECDLGNESVRDLVESHRRNVISEAIMDDEILVRERYMDWQFLIQQV